ncbi:MAG: glycosyltransferase family 9 protein [bacterium]
MKLYQLLAQSILQRNWAKGVGLKYLLTSQTREPESILLIQLSSIGDVVYTTPVFWGLREKFKEAKICFLTEEAPAELVRDDPNLDKVIVFEKAKWAKKLIAGKVDETIRELMAWVEPVYAEQFDLVINLHTSPRSAFLTKLITNKDVWGLTVTDNSQPVVLGHPWIHYKYWITTNPERCHLNPLSSVEIHLLMADVNPSKRRTTISEGGRRNAEGGMENPKLIGIHPGANYPSRRWKVEYFARLVDLLAEAYGAQVVIFGGKDDQDRAAQISAQVRNSAIPGTHEVGAPSPLNLAGQTSLRELTGWLANCRLFISGDTGPAHIAGAVGTPVVVIAGPNWVGPYGPGHLVLQAKVPCRGCAKVTCPEHTCMELITPEAVISAARILLERDGDKAKEAITALSFQQIDLFYSGDEEPTRSFAYFPLNKGETNPSEVIREILRYCFLNIWQGMKDGTDIISEKEILTMVAKRLAIELNPTLDRITSRSAVTTDFNLSKTLAQIGIGFTQIAQLAEEGVSLSRNLYQILKAGQDRQSEINPIISRLDKIDEAIRLRDPLSGLSYMAYIDDAAIQEEGALRTARRSLWCYQHLQRAAFRLSQSLARIAACLS